MLPYYTIFIGQVRLPRLLGRVAIAWIISVACVFVLLGCSRQSVPELIVYTSQDKIYAEPIFEKFEKEHGIRIRAVFDSEAVKTAGLANRLLAERPRPVADVFWNNEEFHTRRLARAGVLQTNWVVLGYRTRELVAHKEMISEIDTPPNLEALTNSIYKNRIVLAYPLFGTTATHFLVLKALWGEERWERWCRHLISNQPSIVDGNSVSALQVARGEMAIGLTDSDDIRALGSSGAAVRSVSLDEDGLRIPNTVAHVNGRTDRAEFVKKFIEFLQSEEVRWDLQQAGAIDSGPQTRHLAVPWDLILSTAEEDLKKLQKLFVRS